jgi:cytochrome c
MKRNALVTIVIACMAAAPAWANPELAQKKNCMACHAVATKVIGPAYKDVANPQVTEAEAKQLVQWILTTK